MERLGIDHFDQDDADGHPQRAADEYPEERKDAALGKEQDEQITPPQTQMPQHGVFVAAHQRLRPEAAAHPQQPDHHGDSLQRISGGKALVEYLQALTANFFGGRDQ